MNQCPVCKGSSFENWGLARDVEYRTSTKTFEYLVCNSCDSLVLPDPPKDYLAEIYPANYYTCDANSGLVGLIKSKIDRRMVGRWLNQFSNMAKIQNFHMGDFGGGSGYFAEICLKIEKKISAEVIDFDANPIQKKTNGIKFINCNLNDSFPDSKYNFIVAWNLLEHLVSPEDFLTSCFNSLDEEGILCIQTPNHENAFARLTQKSYWGGLHTPRHFVIYSPEHLVDSLKRKGFEIVEEKFVQDAHFQTVSICKILGLDRRVSSERSILNTYSYKLLLPIIAFISILSSRFIPTGQIQIIARKPSNAYSSPKSN